MSIVKFPRIKHLYSSPGKSKDDLSWIQYHENNYFYDKKIVVTEKIDGENTTMTRDKIYARSLDSKSHPSRDYVKQIWSVTKNNIPVGWRLCGENMYAVHSIKYSNLPSYFILFIIFDEHDDILSWSDTKICAEEFGLDIVPELYIGNLSGFNHDNVYSGNSLFGGEQEGYVIRNSNQFSNRDFDFNVVKWVRDNHVKTDIHWMNKTIERNGLLNDSKRND